MSGLVTLLVLLWANTGLMPITFFLQGTKRPAAIYVRFREGREIDAKARTRFTVNPEDWSAAKGKAKENDAHGKSLNWELENFRKELVDRLNKRSKTEQVTTEWLKEFISPSLRGSNSLLGCFDSYIQSKEREATEGKTTEGTVKKIKVNRAMLQRFQHEHALKIIHLEDVNLSFISKFKEYCQKQGYAQNTIAKCIKYIVTVCRESRKQGMVTHRELDYIKEKTVRSRHIYLTFEELDKIAQTELPDYLDNARDWLLISCYTGQRVSDFMRFNKEMIHEQQGKRVIEFTQVKTKRVMSIPVPKKVQPILDKRKGDFPRQIADKNYNEFIKEVCKRAGLTERVEGSRNDPKTNRKETGTFQKWELVSSHIGRRSFASNYFGQIPVSLLMFVTGHTTEQQFYEYIGKTERTKAIQLSEYL